MRVKLYWLDEEANWLDKGTGNMEFEDGIFAIKSEENNSLLLRHRLSSAIDYSKQQETLISWSISKDHMYAVSFQDPKECDLIWDAIHDGNQSLLPVLTRDTLAITEATCFECCKSLFGKDQLANFVIHENYLNKSLIPLFIKCEELYLDFQDEASLENLNCISCIFKSLVSLNEHSILESILTDFTNTLGIVEYDREFKNIRANYRDYVSNSVKFKQIIPFPEPIKDTINLVYRIMYLRDIAWARWVDESTFSHLAQVITSHMIDIFGFIQTNESFLKNLFALFNSGDNEKKNEIIFFLVELFHHLKQQQVPPIARTNMLRALHQNGIFSIFEYCIDHEDLKIRLASMSILSAFLESDASPIRSFILSQLRQNQPDLLTLLIQRFLNEPDSGLLSQICDVIRFITDGRNQGGQMNDYEASLDFFYSTHSKLLFEPIMNLDSEQFKNSDGKARLILDKDLNIRINLILEILNFNIVSHVYRSKYNIIDSNISVKIAVLLRSSEGYIRLSALRYFKTIIGMKDEFYNRHLIKFDIFNEIVTALVNTKSKYNLFNSACLNLFHFIYEENIKSLIKYICEKYGSVLKEITYVKTFTDMINRHAKSIGGDSGDKDNEKKDGWSIVDKKEEDYFNLEEVPNFNIPVDNPFNIPIPSFKVKKPSFDDDDDDDFIHKRRSSIDSISKSPKLGGSPIKFKSNFSRGFSTRSLDEINMEPRPDADTAVLSEEISSHKRRKTTESVEDELQ